MVVESGHDSQTFSLHKRKLCEASEGLRERVEALDEPEPIILRDVPFEAFETFSKWIYDGKLEIEAVQEDSEDEREYGHSDSEDSPGDASDSSEDSDTDVGSDSDQSGEGGRRILAEVR